MGWNRISLIGIVIAMLAAVVPQALADGLSLPNPSFEENAAADGVPDGWSIGKGANVSLSSYASDGVKAAKFTDGYILLTIDQKLDHLAGRKLSLTFDAAGENDAELGVMLGYFQQTADGKRKFDLHRLTWGRKLTKDYRSVTLTLGFSAKAVDGRVWIGIYRSNKKGVVYLDHFSCSDQAVSKEDQITLRRMERDWDYLVQRAETVSPQLMDKADIAGIIKRASEVRDQAARLDATLLTHADVLRQERASLGARIYQLQEPGRAFVAAVSVGTLRLDPTQILPIKPPTTFKVLSLVNEDHAIGLTIWNCRPKPVAMTVKLAGLEKASPVVRQQVFMENWYERQKALVTDPLTKLAQTGGQWHLDVPGGSAVKLYIGFKTTAAGSHPVRIVIADQDGHSQTLNATVDVLAADLPTEPMLRHMEFMYPEKSPAGKHPEIAAQDLANHHVTAIEFPYLPAATFNQDGSLAKTNFPASSQNRWMRAYGPKIKHLVLFWATGFKTTDGKNMPLLADDGTLRPEILRAYRELLTSWLDYTAKSGFGVEHWGILPVDEVSSKDQWKTPPGPKVRQFIQLGKIIREVAPKLPIFSTMGFYTMPADVEAIGSFVDVAVAYYPYPEKLIRWSPPGFNPREAFWKITYPYLEQMRQSRGMTISSYHITTGIKDKVLPNDLAYPVEAVANGFTGIGYWAYNVTRGKSWDDTDGGLLDYSFIYDGTEAHPLNAKYNVTREIIVPSIRWEALRVGWQNGQILLALKDRRDHGTLSDELGRKIGAALAEAKGFGDNPESLTYKSYFQFGQTLRRLYASAAQAQQGVTP